MANKRKLIVEVIGDTSSLEKSFRRADRAAQTFGSKVGRATKGIAKGLAFGGVTAGVTGLVAGLKVGFDEYAEGAKVAATTNAIIKSTGGIANVTAKQVDTLATSLLNKTGIDDEQIKAGENLLLTFKNVRNEVGNGNKIFDRATEAALDLSAAGFGSIEGAAKMLGKALNDPLRGISALSRAGVTFSDKQKDMIKALVDSGRSLEAQKIILREVESQVGGTATAVGNTLPGRLNKLRETVTNLAGTIVGQLEPALSKQIDRATKWIQNAENQKKITDAVTGAVKLMRDIISALIPVVRTIATVVKGMTDAVGGAKNATYLLIGAFVAFKALRMASSIGAVTTSLTSPTGLVAAAGVTSFALTTMLLKATGLDKKLKTLGGTAFDLAASLGLVNDRGKQFEGKTLLTPQASKFLRDQATRLVAGGLSPAAAAARIAATHPNVARHDINTLTRGVERIVLHNNITLDGRVVATSVTDRQQKARRRNPEQKRGPFAGGRVQ